MKKLVLLFSIALITINTYAQNIPVKGMVNGATEVVVVFDADGYLAIGNVGPVGDKITIAEFKISAIVKGNINEIKTLPVQTGEAKISLSMRELIKKGDNGSFYVEEIKGFNKNGELVTLKSLKCKL